MGGAGTGGDWREAAGLAAEGGLKAKMALCLQGLPNHVRNFMFSELFSRMEEASMGRLNLSHQGSTGEVKVMARRPRVLEIVLHRQVDPQGGARNIRLYYTEPVGEHILLALALEWKADHPAGIAEQNEHIDLADLRIDEHYR